ncbi:MAG: hypothetical protein V2A66_07820 [Pseudomonadota bacterium]
MVQQRSQISPGMFVRRALRIAAAILVATLVASWAWGSARASVSLASGFAVAAASFAVIALVVVRSLGGTGGKGYPVLIAILGMVKMAVIGAVLWWLLSRGHVEPISFLCGFSTVVLALIVEAVRMK